MKNPIRPKEGARYRYDPIGWDRVDPKPFAGGQPIAAGSIVTVIGGVGGRWKSLGKATLKFVWVRDERTGQEQSVSPGSLFPLQYLTRDAAIMKASLGIKNPMTYASHSLDAHDEMLIGTHTHEWSNGYKNGRLDRAMTGVAKDYIWNKTDQYALGYKIGFVRGSKVDGFENPMNRSRAKKVLEALEGGFKAHVDYPEEIESVGGRELSEYGDASTALIDPLKRHIRTLKNPHTSKAKFWHFRVHDPAEFDPHSFRTITPGGSERVRFVIARRPAANAMDVQKILLLKSAFPKADRAESYANLLIRRGVSAQNPPGTPTEMNPSDEEMPRIYGKTHKITMTKTDGKYRGQKFYHKFGVGVEQHGLPEGTRLKLPSGRELEVPRRSILLTGPKSLWGRYI